MTTSNNEYAAIIARAKRRFPDHQLDIAFPVCLPVYELRLRVIEMAEHDLSTSARFILQLSNLNISQSAELGRLLGISDSYIVEAAAELLNDGLVAQRPDLGIEITDKGREVLNTGGRSLRPRNRHPRVPYDYLSKRIIDMDTQRLLERNDVRKDGLFIVPAKPRRPRVSNLRIDEIREYDRIRTRSRTPTEILEIADIKDMWLKYRNDVILVKLDDPGSSKSTFAAYRAHQYLEEESAAIQRLADSGIDLVPEEFKADLYAARSSSVSASSEETSLISDIEELHSEFVEKDLAVAEAKTDQGTTQSAQERASLARRIEELEAEKINLEARLVKREGELNKLTKGETRLIRTEEHRFFLLQAIDKASSELTLVSAWIDPYAFDNEVCRQLAAAIGRGVTVRIAWGLGISRRRGPDGFRNKVKGDKALAELRKLIPRELRKHLVIKLTETHEKFIICDDIFCAWGSFNWLSYRGQRDSGYRRETSYYSERQSDIALWKQNAASLFQS